MSSFVARLGRRLRALVHPSQLDAELDDEIRSHIELETDDLMRTRGLSREEAHRQAMIAFGGVPRWREAQRDARGVQWIEHLTQDVRYAARSLRKTPGFTATVILVLALGVGANAAMFTLVDRLFFREPSGIVDPQNVMIAYQISGGVVNPEAQPRQIDAIRHGLRGMAATALEAFVYEGSGPPGGMYIARVTDNFFPMLGVRLARGRIFTAEEAADSAPVAVVSYRYWRRTLHGDTAVLGRSIEVAKERYTVVGVAAEDFTGLNLAAIDMWLPLSSTADGVIVLRKSPGVTTERLNAAMTLPARQALPPKTPKSFRSPTMEAMPLIFGRRDFGADPQFEIIERIAGVAAIILLVAIANVATLLLMRAARRRREIAVRLALGISRARLIRQLVVEGAFLSLAASVVALVAGVWGGGVARAQFMSRYRLTAPALDWRFVAFTVGVGLTAGLLASLAPGAQATRPELTQALKAGARGPYRHSWFRGGLVIAQAALSVVLVVGAGLFVMSLRNLHRVSLGIDVDHLMFAETLGRFSSASAFVPVMEQEVRRISDIPGVQAAAVSSLPPLQGELFSPMFRPGGDTLQLLVSGQPTSAEGNDVGPGYFAAVGVHVIDGRDFTSNDTRDSPPVMIVSQTMARLAWPGQRAVGRCLMLGRPTNPCVEVVGVVSDANMWSIKPESGLGYYRPVSQANALNWLAITVRANAATRRTVAQTLRRDLAPRLPASVSLRIQDLRSSLAPEYAQWTEGAVVFSVMGFLALVIAGIGMYGLIGYAVDQRTHEMGVRVALGARRAQVMRPVIFSSLKLALIGVVLGVGTALLLGRLVASLLYGTSPRDPAALASSAVVMLAASVAASLAPAWRASRVDPVVALRAE